MKRFLDRSNDRCLPQDYRGDVMVWDIDKTYLDTHFSSLRGLAAIPFDMAIDKESIPGAVPLLRALRRGVSERSALTPLYFVSGSPIQMRGVIQRKMTIDGVDFDGITFKDQLGLLRRGRVRAIKAQVGYKLLALLLYRREIPDGARWWFFGDDVESDAEVFSIFGRVMAGLRDRALEAELEEHQVEAPEREAILEALSGLPITENPVERAFIHLTRGSDPARFHGPNEVAVRSFLQAALVLAHLDKIRPEAVSTVAGDLRARHVPEARIEEEISDAHIRLAVPEQTLRFARR